LEWHLVLLVWLADLVKVILLRPVLNLIQLPELTLGLLQQGLPVFQLLLLVVAVVAVALVILLLPSLEEVVAVEV
jgi:hypothetical protein